LISEKPARRNPAATWLALGLFLALAFGLPSAADAQLAAAGPSDPSPPEQTVKLIFIHHSCGGNWLADGNGGLGQALRDNNVFVSDTNYGWGPDGIGDNTDIGHWWTWFRGPNSATYLSALYNESGQHSGYSRLGSDPSGENQIIMFKSCYPNSDLRGDASAEPPPIGSNPLRGESASGNPNHTVANAKSVYIDLLHYFATRQDKLFVVITAPPVQSGAWAANARAFNTWLVQEWLTEYPHDNVAVWDFYNVLTSNGGRWNQNDLGWETGNHHRLHNGAVQHVTDQGGDTAAYPDGGGDNHPSPAGNQKASGEFVPLLNVFYHRWMGNPATPTSTSVPPTATSAPPTPTLAPPTPTELAPPTSTLTPTSTQTPTSAPTSIDTVTPSSTLSPPTATATPTSPSDWIYLPMLVRGSAVIAATPTPTLGAAGALDVSLTIANRLPVARQEEYVTFGLPIPPQRNLIHLSELRLLDDLGDPVACQFTPLARWGGAPEDTSKAVRWLLLDFQADVGAGSSADFRLVDSAGPTATARPLLVSENAGELTVNTGAAQFSISKLDGRLTASYLDQPMFGQTTDMQGKVYTTTGPVTIERSLEGPLRVSIRVKGAYRDAGGAPLLDYTSRYWFTAGQPTVRLFHTVENNRLCPLAEYEQLDCYDIGSGGSVTLADLSLLLDADLQANPTYVVSGQHTTTTGSLSQDLRLYQDSSGTEHWDHFIEMRGWDGSLLDTQPRLQSHVSFRGYRTTIGTDEYGPADYGFTLRAGEHKTHELILSSHPLGAAGVTPLQVSPPSEWLVDSGGFGPTGLPDWDGWPQHERYVDDQLDTASTYEEWMDWYPNLPAAIEGKDFYGLFDYGDWPIDYEGYGVATFNGKYDSFQGAWLQWARGGDQRWFSIADAANRHLADIDILHNEHSPRHWGDGTTFGHSYHDEDAFLNPHRNYGGAHPDVGYGLGGLLLTYYVTGYEKAHESARELADNIEYRLRNDTALCPVLDDCSGEGYALMDGMYGGGCRPAANSLSMSVAAYRAWADPRYLQVADALVDWADAQEQPYIDGPTDQDEMMRPWMLNMYLRALADYLDLREEFGPGDSPESQAAANSVLAYGDWLRTYAWLDLPPAGGDARAAYPYEWWFDGRTGIPGEDNDNGDASINNWLLLGADAMAAAYHVSGDPDYVDKAERLFRTGTSDPWYEGDDNTYSSSKETANSIVFGNLFLREWSIR